MKFPFPVLRKSVLSLFIVIFLLFFIFQFAKKQNPHFLQYIVLFYKIINVFHMDSQLWADTIYDAI